MLLTNCSPKIKATDERYTDGKLKYQGSYEHDFFGKTRHGEWIYYYPNRKIKTKGQYIDGEQSGKWSRNR